MARYDSADEVFGIIIEQDFNPDFIKMGLYDEYDEGEKDGMIKGAAITGGIFCGGIGLFCAIREFIKRRRTKKKIDAYKTTPEESSEEA